MDADIKKKKFYLILILGFLTAIGPLSIDMYLPAFPDIAKSLNTSVARVTLSLSSFFIGISVGQLFYGPLLERFGRKKPLYAGTMYLFISFRWLCVCCLCKRIDRTQAITGFRWLCGYGCFTGNGS
jgi:DHA1 family bicyclomycin/chloramphenicol resistance-like MFS transporter